MSGEVAGEQLQYARQVMSWDMSFAELVRRAGVTARDWKDMEEDRVPVPQRFWDLLMNLVGRWHDEQEERAKNGLGSTNSPIIGTHYPHGGLVVDSSATDARLPPDHG